MPRLMEEEFVCPACGRSEAMPKCHGKTMEFDGSVSYCPTCEKEIEAPVCCEKPMRVRRKVRDLRKELFRSL